MGNRKMPHQAWPQAHPEYPYLRAGIEGYRCLGEQFRQPAPARRPGTELDTHRADAALAAGNQKGEAPTPNFARSLAWNPQRDLRLRHIADGLEREVTAGGDAGA